VIGCLQQQLDRFGVAIGSRKVQRRRVVGIPAIVTVSQKM